jgi:hypothetical protein
MDFLWFWKKPSVQPVLPISIQDLIQKDLEGDLVNIDKEDFIQVSTEQAEVDVENPNPPELSAQEAAAMATLPTMEKEEYKTKPNPRKERWERQYRKVFATVTDESGHVFEVRRVNQDRQLAFWDCHHNTQIYVYPGKREDQLENRTSVFTMMK